MQVPISEGHSALSYHTCTCFTIWRDHIWVGTNRGSIAVMDTQERCCVREIVIPAGGKRQVEIKHLALSSEDEVRGVACGGRGLESVGVVTVQLTA